MLSPDNPSSEVAIACILPIVLIWKVIVITPIITTTLKYPDAVGEARNVEPDEEGLNPGESLRIWLSSRPCRERCR